MAFSSKRTCYPVSIVGKGFVFELASKTPLRNYAIAAKLAVQGQKGEAKKKVSGEPLNEIGMKGMYRMMIDTCQQEFGTAITLMLDESSFPMMYYCQHGKDRTGLVSTFLLWSLGLPRDKIIAEYHQSELNLSVIQETVHSDFQSIGAIEEFEKTPAEVLEASLDYIESKYKGISNYLRLCGISITLQNRLKAIFLEKVDPMVLAFPS